MKSKNIKGLTLLELIITIALIGIIGLVVISTFTNYSVSVFKSGYITEDTLTARETMDKLIAASQPKKEDEEPDKDPIDYIITHLKDDSFETSNDTDFIKEDENTEVALTPDFLSLGGSAGGGSVEGTLVTVKTGSENPIILTAFIPDQGDD